MKFAHQSLCNPKILTLLKVVRKGFLRGCPNMSKKLILKYLNPSPATAKGHMKRSRHGIRSTRQSTPPPIVEDYVIPPIPTLPILYVENIHHDAPIAVFPALNGFFQHTDGFPNIIVDNDDDSTANIFCSVVFANKNSGVVYSDLTRNFLFMPFDRNVCFIVVYHYESNAIMATPIAGLDNMTIFKANKALFQDLMEKRFKQKLNVIDNQAMKYICKFLMEEE